MVLDSSRLMLAPPRRLIDWSNPHHGHTPRRVRLDLAQRTHPDVVDDAQTAVEARPWESAGPIILPPAKHGSKALPSRLHIFFMVSGRIHLCSDARSYGLQTEATSGSSRSPGVRVELAASTIQESTFQGAIIGTWVERPLPLCRQATTKPLYLVHQHRGVSYRGPSTSGDYRFHCPGFS